MPIYPRQDPSLDENHQRKGGGQFQLMDENGEGPQWSQLMGLMHALFEHTPLHEQVPVCDARIVRAYSLT